MLNKIIADKNRKLSDQEIHGIIDTAMLLGLNKMSAKAAENEMIRLIEVKTPVANLDVADKLKILLVIIERIPEIHASISNRRISESVINNIMEMSMRRLHVDIETRKLINAYRIINPVRHNLNSMLDNGATVLVGERAPTLNEAAELYVKMYGNNEINTENFTIPNKADFINSQGHVSLSPELRMNSIKLLEKLVDKYFNNEHKISENKEIAKTVLSVIKLSGEAALQTIFDRIQHGKINPLGKNPEIITFAGTANPLHYPHILTALEALAYSDHGEVVEFLTHAIDPRKSDLLHFFHRFEIATEVISQFSPLIRMHPKDVAMHNELTELAKKGDEIRDIDLATAYSARSLITQDGRELPVSAGTTLSYLPADGETKLFQMMMTAKERINKFLTYIAGSDHRKVVDTHKKSMGLMLDTVGKLALEVKKYHEDKELEYNREWHTVQFLCNIRNPKDINNAALLRQFGMFVFGLEKGLLSPQVIKSAFESTDRHNLVNGPVMENYDFIKENMTDNFELSKVYIGTQLNKIVPETILNKSILYNVDDLSDKTHFTIENAITASGVDAAQVIADIVNIKNELLTALPTLAKKEFNNLLDQKSVEVMQKILGITDMKNEKDVITAINHFLGIRLVENYASTSFSSTQVRDYFNGKATNSWAALMLPMHSLMNILNLISRVDGPYHDQAKGAYKIKNTLSMPDAGLTNLAERLEEK